MIFDYKNGKDAVYDEEAKDYYCRDNSNNSFIAYWAFISFLRSIAAKARKGALIKSGTGIL